MWINRNSEYTQITTNSTDVTAVVVEHGGRNILMASICVLCIGLGQETGEQELYGRLQDVQMAIPREITTNLNLEVFDAGDFNRHDIVWGGNEVALGLRQEIQ